MMTRLHGAMWVEGNAGQCWTVRLILSGPDGGAGGAVNALQMVQDLNSSNAANAVSSKFSIY